MSAIDQQDRPRQPKRPWTDVKAWAVGRDKGDWTGVDLRDGANGRVNLMEVVMKTLASGIVYVNPKPYLRSQHAFHPTISDLGEGELLCSYDLGEAIEAMNYQTYRSRSVDGGETWQFEGPIVTVSSERRCVYSIRTNNLSTGLVGIGQRCWRDDPEEGVLNRDNLGYAPMDTIMVRSDDKGKTWSEPLAFESPLEGPAFETCHNVVELPGGRWLWPTSTWRGWDGALPNGEKGVVFISEDQGATWPEYGVTFSGDAEGIIHWEQSTIALGGYDVLSIAWVYHPASGQHRPNHYAISHDAGNTWSPARKMGLDGQTCKALRLRDGRILFAYRRNDKPGLWANLSELDGEELRHLDEKPLWGAAISNSGMVGDGNNSDELSSLKFGFPQMIELDENVAYLVFWCFEDWCTRIRWMRIDVAA